ncbi:MAG TPA: hypothetical protein VEX39_16675 [Thermoleophilaceae bacterium]|nr:hypothetical protein [Thermoleophilaceae bacterium]
MAQTTQQQVDVLQNVSEAVKDLDGAAQQAAIRAVISPPDTATTNELWLRLITGLLVLTGLALAGLIYLIADGKSSDIVLTAFTGLLTGLIGLFAPSPVKAGGTGG